MKEKEHTEQLIEVEYSELLKWMRQQKEDVVFVLFIYTPLCGTCKLAEKMLRVTGTMFPQLVMFKGNILHFEEWVYKYEIKSVPCVMIWKNGNLISLEYAIGSVDHLYNRFLKLIN